MAQDSTPAMVIPRRYPPLPLVGVAAAVFDATGHVLLVQRGQPPRQGQWGLPGGLLELGERLETGVRREVREECGIDVSVGPLVLVNEFHDPRTGFHQVDLFFRCRMDGGALDPGWTDPERVVHTRRFFSPSELGAIRLKPDSLPVVAFGGDGPSRYDPLEEIVL